MIEIAEFGLFEEIYQCDTDKSSSSEENFIIYEEDEEDSD